MDKQLIHLIEDSASKSNELLIEHNREFSFFLDTVSTVQLAIIHLLSEVDTKYIVGAFGENNSIEFLVNFPDIETLFSFTVTIGEGSVRCYRKKPERPDSTSIDFLRRSIDGDYFNEVKRFITSHI